MPADRGTTTSFLQSIATGAPLSSHGAGHAASLERGKACLVCRNRKVKCDGVKPCCGACRRSAISHSEDPNQIVCNYDESEAAAAPKRRRGAGGQARLKELQDRIAELEGIIAQSTSNDQAPSNETSALRPSTSGSIIQIDHQQVMLTPSHNFDILLQASQPNARSNTSAYFSNYTDISGFNPGYGMPSAALDILPASPQDSGFYDLLYPGWPKDLPSPALTTRLIEVYFAKNHVASGMINPHKFMHALQLPPTQNKFPSTALIHAMLANSTRMISEDFYLGEPKYWGKIDINETMSDYHAKCAKLHVDESIATYSHLLQTTQAVVLLCFYAYTSARFLEVWLNCGLALRCVTPLGLNHLKSASASVDDYVQQNYAKISMLKPTDDLIELQERSYTFWLAFMADRFSAASTGWASGIDETDITTTLPSASFLNSQNFSHNMNPLSPRDANFMIAHPPHLVGGFQLFIKAVVLLGRITNFLQRSPTPAWKVGVPSSDEAPVDLRSSRLFRQLDSDAKTFLLSIPREYHNVQQLALQDTRLCLVFSLPHAATILLHEPWTTSQPGDLSMARCSKSARAILEDIYTLFSTSFEIAILSPYINFAWAVAGRTFVRELAILQSRGILAGQDELRADIQVILSAMRSYRSPLGMSVAASLQRLLDDPSQCLPHAMIHPKGAGMQVTCPVEHKFPYNNAYPPASASSLSAPSTSSSPSSNPPATPNAFSQQASASTLSAMLYGPTPLTSAGDMPGKDAESQGRFFDLDAMGPFVAGQWPSSG